MTARTVHFLGGPLHRETRSVEPGETVYRVPTRRPLEARDFQPCAPGMGAAVIEYQIFYNRIAQKWVAVQSHQTHHETHR